MIILYFTVFFIILSFQFFNMNLKIQGLNRAVISTPIELMYQHAYQYGDELSFRISTLRIQLDDYYELSVGKYTNDYDIDYYFYNKEDDSMCVDSYCNAVEITVTARLELGYEYKRIMFYELEGLVYG